MSKTAREVLTEQIVGPSPGHAINDAEVDAIFAELAAAGFVNVPKEPTNEMLIAGTAALTGESNIGTLPPGAEARLRALVCYRAMIAAAKDT